MKLEERENAEREKCRKCGENMNWSCINSIFDVFSFCQIHATLNVVLNLDISFQLKFYL
jgi:predicted  nucleic acid-binding Zn ribbon protein